MQYQLFVGVLFFIASLVVAYVVVRFSPGRPPTDRCSHILPTPTGGGLSFVVAFLVGILLYGFSLPFAYPYMLGVVLLAAAGLYDDFALLSYRIRLCVQIVCAFLMITAGGVVESPMLPQGSSSVDLFLQIISFISFLCIINGANFIDGLNGLLGLSVMICIGFAPLWCDFNPVLTQLHIILIAGILGFVCFNFPKAKLFMGDTGSTFLGYTLMFLALSAQHYYPLNTGAETAIFNKGFVFTLLPLAFLWFDVAFTLCRRAVRGCRLTEAHRQHLIHVLFDSGHSHVFVTILYALGTLLMGGLTYACHIGVLSFITVLLIYSVLQILLVFYVFGIAQKRAHSQCQPS